MDIFIYTYGRLPCGKDEVEEALESALGDKGELTGSGSGAPGCNFDLLIADESVSEEEALTLVRRALAEFDLPAGTKVDIDGTMHLLD